MASTRAVKRKQQTQTYRMRVLEVIEATDQLFTGHQVAQLTGLTHKQAIDALNGLLNLERIVRTGRKFTARWGRLPQQLDENPALTLEKALRRFFT